jgi:hypothetical protein
VHAIAVDYFCLANFLWQRMAIGRFGPQMAKWTMAR